MAIVIRMTSEIVSGRQELGSEAGDFFVSLMGQENADAYGLTNRLAIATKASQVVNTQEVEKATTGGVTTYVVNRGNEFKLPDGTVINIDNVGFISFTEIIMICKGDPVNGEVKGWPGVLVVHDLDELVPGDVQGRTWRDLETPKKKFNNINGIYYALTTILTTDGTYANGSVLVNMGFIDEDMRQALGSPPVNAVMSLGGYRSLLQETQEDPL